MIEPETLLDHRDFVHALARELVRDPAAADDVAQEAFVAAWQRGDAETRAPRGLLATIARNLARQFHRRDERRRERERSAAPRERLPSVADVVEREERRRSVVAAVLALPELERVAVLLRFYDGLAPRQIARRLGVPTETARTRVKRGVEQVRAKLVAQRGDDQRALLAWLLPLARPAASTLSTTVKWGLLAASGLVAAGIAWKVVEPRWNARADARTGDAAPSVAAASAEPLPTSPDAALAANRAADPASSSASPIDVAAPAAPEQGEMLAGRVVDARGAPVADAQVLAWPDALDEPIRLDDAATLERTRPHARTDASGRFELRLPAGLDRATLFATARDLSPGTMQSVAPGDAVTLVLEDDDVLVGTVTDDGGKPVAGAHVRAWGMHGGALIEHATKTGADGGYRLPFPSADRAAWQGDSESWMWWIEASAEGFAPRVVRRARSLEPDVRAREVRLDVTLRLGAQCDVAVVDGETRAPIAGARVVLVAFEEWMGFGRKIGGNLRNPYGERVLGEDVTDEAGLATFTHVLARVDEHPTPENRKAGDAPRPRAPRMQIYVVAADRAVGLADPALVEDGGTARVTVELWRAATVVGRVVDRERRPVAGVRVDAGVMISAAEIQAGATRHQRFETRACFDPSARTQRRSDERGRYEIAGIPVSSQGAATVRVAVDDRAWILPPSEDSESSGVRVEATAGAVVTAPDLVVVPERSVLLEVVDEAGAPIAGADVSLLPRGNRSRRTDATGRLRWCEDEYVEVDEKGIGEVRNHQLRFRIGSRGFVSTVTELFEPSVTASPLARIVLARGHTLRGMVVDHDQEPAARALVRVWRRSPTSEELAAPDSLKLPADPRLLLSSCATDSAGGFRFDDLPDGRWVVQISPPVAWRGKRREKSTLIPDIPVDGAPETLRFEME